MRVRPLVVNDTAHDDRDGGMTWDEPTPVNFSAPHGHTWGEEFMVGKPAPI